INLLGSSGAEPVAAIIGGSSGISTLTINYTTLTAPQSFSRFLGGAGCNQNNIALVFGGPGATKMNANNLYIGGTTLNGGTLIASQVNALGANNSPLTLNAGVLDLQTNTSIAGYNTAINGNVTIQPDVNAATTAGITQNLGTLNIGANTLT